ncbi:unnamed protein product [Mucor hiemalis]
MSRVPSALNPTEEDIQLLLSAQCHIGAKNANTRMAPYIHKRRADGINLINIGKTWEKLILAARVIAAIENPQDIVVVSARPYGHRAALKFARYIGAEAIVGRFTPGTFTNYITRSFREPRLVIVPILVPISKLSLKLLMSTFLSSLLLILTLLFNTLILLSPLTTRLSMLLV